MKVLLNKKLVKEISNITDESLRKKILKSLELLKVFFRDLNNYDHDKIHKLKMSKANIFVYKIDMKYRMLFTSEYDENNELNIVVMEIVKHDDFERKAYRLLNE